MNAGWPQHRTRLALALAALVTGTAAAFVGTPEPPLAADEVAAVELAGWLRERRPDLTVVDLRPPADGQERLPTARPLDASTPDGTVVVYADNGVDADTTAALRERLGSRRVLRLHGGMRAWNDDVLFPTLRGDASAGQRRAFEARAQLSRYFGGSPRRLDPGATPARGRSRRGC
jgi:rhodanese-related sulfurtransferase